MQKTQKELAFIRDLFVDEEWTRRFTELADKHIDLRDAENLLYINSGTGTHCIEIRHRADDDLAIFAACENEDMLNIARDKAIAAKADVDFSMIDFDSDAFDVVVADASFTPAAKMTELVSDAVRVAKPGGHIAVLMPSAGTFGEIYSLLWEGFINTDLGQHSPAVERMVSETPTLSQIESIASDAGLVKIKTHSAIELFEYENGEAFLSSPLVSDFLLPQWLKTLDENEKEQVSTELARLIDAEDGDLTFRFTVKATVLTGEKG
jgi:ubiquinone/menaquinone biosynthesis C-methylase UbiE